MGKVFYPPTPVRTRCPKIFLAGTIDQGASRDWQAVLVQELAQLPVAIVNPRRPQWNPSWDKARPIKKQLKEQILWELNNQERADLIAMWFEPASRSPITMLELGLFGRGKKMMIGCPQAFYRYANIKVTADWLGLKVYESFDSFCTAVVAAAKKL